jgi:hypothetical protein
MISLIAALSLSFLAAPITPGVSDAPVPLNLDADPALERLLYHQRSSDFAFQAQVRDRCDDTRRTWRLSPYENKFNAIEAIEADGTTPQPEVFFYATGLHEALTDRLVKLVRFDQADGACARPRVLFRYHPRPARNGRGTSVIATRVTDVDPSRPGLEIRLKLGTFARVNGEAHLVRRVTRVYGYAPGADRYTRIRTDC